MLPKRPASITELKELRDQVAQVRAYAEGVGLPPEDAFVVLGRAFLQLFSGLSPAELEDATEAWGKAFEKASGHRDADGVEVEELHGALERLFGAPPAAQDSKAREKAAMRHLRELLAGTTVEALAYTLGKPLPGIYAYSDPDRPERPGAKRLRQAALFARVRARGLQHAADLLLAAAEESKPLRSRKKKARRK